MVLLLLSIVSYITVASPAGTFLSIYSNVV